LGANRDKITVVGLPDTVAKESKYRVTSAITNSVLRSPSSKTNRNQFAKKDLYRFADRFGHAAAEADIRLPDLRPFCLTGELAFQGSLVVPEANSPNN
jgi:predicted ATPase with chaperone activity